MKAIREQLVDSGARSSEPRWYATKSAVKISLVLPMYNEGLSVDTTMQTVLAKLDKYFEDFEVIVVDDASTDSCAMQVAHWVERDPRIRLVCLPHNQRFGGALRAGLAAASKDFVFYTDFDLQVGLDCFPQMIEQFGEADVLTGYSAEQTKHASWRS